MRHVWIAAGMIALMLGALGVLLPVLPTTPFVLLAAFCFGKGSPRLRNLLTSNPTFGPYIEDWETRGAIPRRAKILACLVMGLTLGASVVFGLALWVIAVQAVAMAGAATFILTRPS